MNKIVKVLKNPEMLIFWACGKGLLDSLTDEKYLKLLYRLHMKKQLRLDSPKTFNEKLQWLKLYNRRPEYTDIVDKYKVRDYIADKIGKEYLIPLEGVWDKPEQIDFDALPERFVLKCNHNSGLGMCICKDKSALDREKAVNDLREGLKENYYLRSREWPYKNVERKIIAEKFMEDFPGAGAFSDYKFFCFSGKADCVMVCLDRASGDTKCFFFNREWQLLKYNKRVLSVPDDFSIPQPEKMPEMFEIAEKLSQGFPFVRVDLYCSNGQIYFGELTFFSDSGFDGNLLEAADIHFGNLIELPEKTTEE